MPEETLWATFFNADCILTQLQCDDSASDVIEFGCGYGTFTIAAAARTSGTVFALDVEPEMLVITENKARAAGRTHVRTVVCDFVANGVWACGTDDLSDRNAAIAIATARGTKCRLPEE